MNKIEEGVKNGILEDLGNGIYRDSTSGDIWKVCGHGNRKSLFEILGLIFKSIFKKG